MIRFPGSQRFLAAYSAVVTVLFLCGLNNVERKQTFDEITVHRINIVEPDGTIRMVVTNSASAPGIYMKNKEYPHPNRKSAGMIFYDNEGNEDGGLLYGIGKDSSGNVVGSGVHLSFDQYMQDQIFTIDAGREGKNKYSTLTMQDRGDYSILDAMEVGRRIAKLPEDQRAAEWKKFAATHPGDHMRVELGRAFDDSSVLRLKDTEGRDRIVLQVAPDGTPKVQLLDAAGKVISELPQTNGAGVSHP